MPPSTQGDRSQCPHCHQFYTKKGLNTHIARMHKNIVQNTDLNSTQEQDLEEILIKYKTSVRVLSRIPKAARISASAKLTNLIDNCVSLNDVDSWKTLLLFPYASLQKPDKNSGLSLSAAVKRNIINASPPTLIKPNHRPKFNLNKKVQAKVDEGDIRGAITLLSSNDSFAPFNEDTLESLKKKHPSPSRDLAMPTMDNSMESLVTTSDLVFEAIKSFNNGSAGGLDSLRPQHLKDLTATGLGNTGAKLVSSLTKLVNLLLSGEVNSVITPILFGASLCALSKKDGGIRPIAVGCVYRRLAAKLACHSVREEVGSILRPKQLGFGTKAGCEAAVHSTRSFINSKANSDKVILKIDQKNAFNSIERDNMLQQVLTICPKLFPFFNSCYSSSSNLFFGNNIIMSQVGAQQGDPGGPLLYCLAINNLIQELSSELNVWYLDDGTLGGSPDMVLKDLQHIISSGKHLGLEINPSKCELFFCSEPNEKVIQDFQSIAPGIRITSSQLTLLGAPLVDSATSDVFAAKLDELQLLLSRILNLNKHTAYFLLKSCTGIPKLTYLIRNTPLHNHLAILKEFDNFFKEALTKITNLNFDAAHHDLSSLPVNFGGLGIRKLEDLYLPAFLSSISSVEELMVSILSPSETTVFHGYLEAKDAWTQLELPQPADPLKQKNWDLLNIHRLISLLEPESTQEKARFYAVMTPEAGAWLHAIPISTIGTLLSDIVFQISVALRMGISFCQPHLCKCGDKVSEFGIHGLSCRFSAGRHSRHQEINSIVAKALSSAHIPSLLEPVGLSPEDGKRADGVTLIPWSNGKCLAWDSTCPDTLAPSNIQTSAKSVGATANAAAAIKIRKYSDIVERGLLFLPFAVETLGSFGDAAIQFTNDLGRRLKDATGEPKSKSYLIQRISLAIQRGNVASVLGTLPYTSSLDEIFLL